MARVSGERGKREAQSAEAPRVRNDWENAPTPILVVEILSDATRRRDLDHKRRFYMDDVRVAEYWAVDPDTRLVHVARPGLEDRVEASSLTWHPAEASASLTIDLVELLG